MYVPSEKDQKNLENNFNHHVPQAVQTVRYEEIRAHAKEFCVLLTSYCPPSRELSLALTNMEQAVMWANASIARNE